MDELDRAQAITEVMDAHREMHKPVPVLIPNGRCHYCDAPIRDGWKFCDAEHGHAYLYELERRRINRIV
jgi:predicted nucleic acid-binding Zn ribbon protein